MMPQPSAIPLTLSHGARLLARQVLRGLGGAGQKTLPARLLYDEAGSRLFEQITALPEYGLARADRTLLRQLAPALALSLPTPLAVLELGSGNGEKTRPLLAALAARHPLRYFPLEISPTALAQCRAAAAQLSYVEVAPLAGEYLDGLRQLRRLRRPGEHALVLFIGSSIGNFDRKLSLIADRTSASASDVSENNASATDANASDAAKNDAASDDAPDDEALGGEALDGEALDDEASSDDASNDDASNDGVLLFLRQLRATLRAGDRLLLGTDLEHDPAQLLLAYDDRAGVTAAFNLNLLARLNRELGADFDLSAFHHQARYDPNQRRVEMHLIARRSQVVHFTRCGFAITFTAGESIWTESSHKFSLEEVAALARRAGFHVAHHWTSTAPGWPCAESLLVAR